MAKTKTQVVKTYQKKPKKNGRAIKAPNKHTSKKQSVGQGK
jgi:hypothetical protein